MELAKDSLICILTKYSLICDLEDKELEEICCELEEKLRISNLLKKNEPAIYKHSFKKSLDMGSSQRNLISGGNSDVKGMFGSNDYIKNNKDPLEQIDSAIEQIDNESQSKLTKASESQTNLFGVNEQKQQLKEELFGVFLTIKEGNPDFCEINKKLLKFLSQIVKIK